ncbi:MAG: tetratricopeptide repeat protein [Clostridia bacterium]|nr:tetratricopeptide repeat protein [Clostridia bacterium]
MDRKKVLFVIGLALVFALVFSSSVLATTDKDKKKGMPLFVQEMLKEKGIDQPLAKTAVDAGENGQELMAEIEGLSEEMNELEKEMQGLEKEALQAHLVKMHKTRAQILAKLNHFEQAMEELEKAIAIDRKNPEAYKEIGKLYKEAGKPGINVFVNGKKPVFDTPPVIKDGRTLVPVRAIVMALGADVKWDAENKEITITKGEKVIILKLDSKTALINGVEHELDVPAKSVNARTVLPLRFISEALKTQVNFDQETGIIIIVDDEEGTEEEESKDEIEDEDDEDDDDQDEIDDEDEEDEE